MTEQEFKGRTKQFAVDIIKVISNLPKSRETDVMGRQLLRSATSVGANYRAACRAKSKRDMIAKLSIVEEEADESLYWMELLIASGLCTKNKFTTLLQEGNEIVAMTVASIKTLRRRL